uniref:Jasmonate O-methyltransferase n=1 Tax=Fagus sylvatica TaxID=28930 RepID=A0A2N9FFP4_FAGSY
MLKKTVRALYSKENFPQYFTVADLGCSSGPNTLSPTYEMIDAIVGLCRETGHAPPELLVFLNDLPSNDFNTGFRSLPDFYNMLKKEKGDDLGPCFIAGMPGSFYGRLFPSKTLNFVHSSYSVHWLSKQSRPSVVVSQPSPRMKSLCWEASESANDRRASTWREAASATMSMSFSLSTILRTSSGVSLGTKESMLEVVSPTSFSSSFHFRSGPFGKKERESFKAKP